MDPLEGFLGFPLQLPVQFLVILRAACACVAIVAKADLETVSLGEAAVGDPSEDVVRFQADPASADVAAIRVRLNDALHNVIPFSLRSGGIRESAGFLLKIRAGEGRMCIPSFGSVLF